jgi:reactive chlorine resistance protein C
LYKRDSIARSGLHYAVERDRQKMAQDQFAPMAPASQQMPRHHRIAGLVARYALVVVIAWFGAMKFTHHEAYNISRFVAHSPLMSWTYNLMSIRTFGALTGVAELATAALLAVKPWSPRLSVLGGALATLFFVGTLSFMISTPGIGEPSAGGFPVLSDNGEFLMKDIALLGLALWTLSDSWEAARRQANEPLDDPAAA